MASTYLIYFASTRPLAEVSITDISNVLAADKELMFNIHVKGRNTGLWNVEIVNADLGVFATPVENNTPGGIPGGPGSHWDDDVSGVPINKVAPSEFLGSILVIDEPLVFSAGINRTGVVSEPSGQVRLRNPGGENDKRGACAKAFWRLFSGPVLRVRRFDRLPHSRIHTEPRRGGKDAAAPGIALRGVWDKESDFLPEQRSMAPVGGAVVRLLNGRPVEHRA